MKGDATAGFSGFLYQADVALWKTLEKIKDIGFNNQTDLEKWCLEVEGEEDFTLFNLEGGIDFRESYQVKETKGDKASDYTIPVIKLFEEFKKGENRKEFLVTEKEIEALNNIDFFNGLYAGEGLTENQKKLEYLSKGIGGNCTFLTSKIECNNGTNKYKFIDGETKESIENFVLNETIEFVKDENFTYITAGNKDVVHGKIKELIKELIKEFNTSIDPEYHFRYLESKIKRFIQERKKDLDYPKITFIDIVEVIKKDGGEILDEIVNGGFYQDLFFNHFIVIFNKQIDEIIEDIYLLNKIKSDPGIVFDDFIGIFKERISNNIFVNSDKLYRFIIDTSLKNGEKYFNNQKRKETFTDFKNNISNYIQSDVLKRKALLLINLFYLKDKGLNIEEDNYFQHNGKTKTGFKINNKIAILTGNESLNRTSEKSDIIHILNKNLDYLYEKDFIGITDSYGNIYEILDLKSNIEEKKFIENLGIEKEIEEGKYNITKIKNIKIFCCNCEIIHKEKMLSNECGIDKNTCKYKG